MARVIEFRIPENYDPKRKPMIVAIPGGKVIKFPTTPTKHSA